MAEDGSLPIGGSTVSQLQSQEQAGLLDAIDQLRRENIDADIGIPQIVVCGDQSSGKSSLLEAIAQVPFPAGSGAVTMFATELVLRRAAFNYVYAAILPHWKRTAEERDKIAKFLHKSKRLDHDEFKNLYTAASAHLEEIDGERGFRYDTLSINVSGPTQPHLTLIDLPGLIRTTTGGQSPGDVKAIHELTTSYLQRPRTIVLAVVSATSDFQVQSIGDLMRSSETAPRMMGVITKPDGVLSQGDALQMVKFASNEELRLGLGWHVVRNLSHEQLDRSPQRRDSEERTFFGSGIWSRLPSKDLGIESLRQKLCQRLFESIKRTLPQLILEMNDKLATTRHSIAQLGRVRKNTKDCLWYLSEIKSTMQQLISAASEGVYDDPNISTFFGKGDFTKLRNLITRRSDTFNREIRGSGKTFTVSTDPVKSQALFGTLGEDHAKPIFQWPYYLPLSDKAPCKITAQSYCRALSMNMTQNIGKNLPDLPNFRDIQAVFRSQSVRWKHLARAHVESCYEDTLRFMSEATLHVAGPYTSARLLEEYIRPSLENRHAVLAEKVDELLWPFEQCHPITSRPGYATMARLFLDSNDQRQTEGSRPGTTFLTYAQRMHFTIEQMHAANVLDRAEAYYQIALDTFVDNIATLAIERVLLTDLPSLILSSCEPSSLSDEQLEFVAGESQAVKEQRAKAMHRVAALEAVIRTCQRYKGTSQSTPQKPMPTERYFSIPEANKTTSQESSSQAVGAGSKSSVGTSKGTKFAFTFGSPATSKLIPSERPSHANSASPLSSASRNAKSNGSASSPLPSTESSPSEQEDNKRTRLIAYMPALFPDEDDKTAEVKLTKEEEFAKAVEKIEADCEKYFEAEALAALNS